MAAFKVIRTADADLSEVQDNIRQSFADLPADIAPKFVTTSAAQYRIDGTETHVFVDAKSSPVVVVLPAGGTAPVIKRIDSTPQVVHVQAIDRALIDGGKTLAVAKLSALRLVFDGKAWWSV